jgi:hypothetical protein
MNSNIKIVFLTSAFLFSLAAFTFAQSGAVDEPVILPSNDSGELSASVIDGMRSTIGDERLFVIARSGTGETKSRITRNRLAYAKWFMLVRTGFNRQTSVFAEGEPIKGEGRIEFYIGSRLHLVILAPRNKIPNLTCCPDYIAPTKKKQKKKRKG